MNHRGFSSIGLVKPKTGANIGSVLRAAGCYECSSVIVENPRHSLKQATDTAKIYRQIPVMKTECLKELIPVGCTPVAIDLVNDAISLVNFIHPERAFYIFGPEDGTLGKKHLDVCAHKVMIPTKFCMNLAATVNVVLYDRLFKQMKD